jgi:hypothetical protein
MLNSKIINAYIGKGDQTVEEVMAVLHPPETVDTSAFQEEVPFGSVVPNPVPVKGEQMTVPEISSAEEEEVQASSASESESVDPKLCAEHQMKKRCAKMYRKRFGRRDPVPMCDGETDNLQLHKHIPSLPHGLVPDRSQDVFPPLTLDENPIRLLKITKHMFEGFKLFRENLREMFNELNADNVSRAYNRCQRCWCFAMYKEHDTDSTDMHRFLQFVRADLVLYNNHPS